MPAIGCGLGRFVWPKLRALIQYVFQTLKIKIIIFLLKPLKAIGGDFQEVVSDKELVGRTFQKGCK